MKRQALTATRLRLILAVALFSIVLVAAVGFGVIHGQLSKFAVEVSHVTADAEASQTTVQTLQKIQKELELDKDVIKRTSSIVADSQSYQYQDQIITELNGYAAKAGLSLSSINFSTDDKSAPATDNSSTATPAPSAPAGVKSTSVSIAIKNPVVYENLLRFIKSIEQNLTKMQISNISMAKDAENNIVSEDLIIEVYVK